MGGLGGPSMSLTAAPFPPPSTSTPPGASARLVTTPTSSSPSRCLSRSPQACPPAASALAPTTSAPATSPSAAVARPQNTPPASPRSERCAASPPLPCSEAPISSSCLSGAPSATSNRSQTVAGVSAGGRGRSVPIALLCVLSVGAPLGGTPWPSALPSASLTLDRARRANGTGRRLVQRMLEGPHAESKPRLLRPLDGTGWFCSARGVYVDYWP
ncbi:hypothetical protein CC86DRAFT_159211 [Ophiobolus disseminans]|uniref:Uncharacterized protein n=1 Tax=Ophiobolus disseminans TaxID=1469910 RepID=A0A6A6ZB24_9PLEO|nr:hypothetical protein CC86DRAFT_159211 [Ophiobolus disseminans]